jgi:hypothetical protein
VFASGDNPWLVHQVHTVPNLRARLRQRGDCYRVCVAPPRAAAGTYGEEEEGQDDGAAAAAAPRRLRRRRGITELEPPLECGGAVLSVRVTGDDQHLLVNVRPFVDSTHARCD